MTVITYLREQKQRHSAMTVTDAVKLCYQAAYGAEHLLDDPEAARAYLEKELAEVEMQDGDLYEQISDEVCRVNLATWKYAELPVEWLWRMFEASAQVKEDAEMRFFAYLQEAQELFAPEEWEAFFDSYGGGAIRHSEVYRREERPAYRIVHHRFVRILPVLEWVARHGEKGVIAIDGRAASGKTTAAEALQTVLGCDAVHMDDFFLPEELRQEQRLWAPGGNIHYERFAEEVLPHLGKKEHFSYRVFDCGAMEYRGEREIKDGSFCVVEGSYACHEAFWDYADLRVFSDVAPIEQKRRILQRNGAEMTETFCRKWIPMEEKYFETFALRERADIMI